MPSASLADHCTSTPPHRDQVRLCSTTDKFFITQCEPDPGGGRCARCPPHDTYPTYRQIVPCRSPSLRHSFFDMESPSTGAQSRSVYRLCHLVRRAKVQHHDVSNELLSSPHGYHTDHVPRAHRSSKNVLVAYQRVPEWDEPAQLVDIELVKCD